MGWIVYSKDGQTVRCVLHKLEYSGTFMGDRSVIATFSSEKKIDFNVFDYITYRGEHFELELLPTVKKVSTREYKYELRFVSLKYELERCMMRNIVPGDNGIVYPTPLTVEFTGDVKYLAERIQACLDAMYGKGTWSITIAEGTESEEKNISMSNQNCWDALSIVNTEYKLNYFIKGRNVIIGGEEPVVDNVFEYGKGKGLYEIERISDTDTGVVTKLRAYGGTRNLDYSYPKLPEWKDSVLPTNYALSPLRLMLPSFKTDGKTDYILAPEEAIAKYGIREGVITYDDIYPSITGMKNSEGQAIDEIKSVSAITSDTQPTFTVGLYDLGFDLSESLTTDEAQLSMKSGALQGYTFNITKIDRDSDGSYTLTLGRNTLEEGDTGNFTVPNKDWSMKAGDKFVLLNILMPQEYIRDAENRLLTRAKEYLAKYSSTNYSYNVGVDEIFMARNVNFYNDIMEGKRLTVNDQEIGINNENIIIQSLTIKEGEGIIPTFEVTLNNEATASTLDRIQGQISEVETSVSNNFSSQSELLRQYRKKLDKSVWDSIFVIHKDDPENPEKITSVQSLVGLWTNSFLSAKGLNPGSGGGSGEGGATALYQLNDVAKNDSETNVLGAAPGKVLTYGADGKWYAANAGMDETALNKYLTDNKYATQPWVLSQLGNQYDLPIASATVLGGVMIGSTLNASATGVLDLNPVGVVGVYTKVTTDAYGRVVSGSLLSEEDIPELGISKITGLQAALDSKLNKADFASYFATEIAKWFIRDVNGKAIYPAPYDNSEIGFYSNSFISAKGLNPNSGGSSGGVDYDRLDSWSDYDSSKSGWVLSAGLGHDLDTRVSALESQSITLATTGTGNGLSGFTQVGNVVTFTKATFLTEHQSLAGYATESWVLGKNYATISNVDDRINALINGAPDAFDTLKEIADVLQANVDQIDDLLTAIGSKADKTTSIIAGTGLSGGGSLASNRTISLKPATASALGGIIAGETLSVASNGTLDLKSGITTDGTYTKVTVDTYGRVTSGTGLAASDIPSLSISKITGLQTALDSKLTKTDFASYFATEIAKWFVRDVNNKAIYPAAYSGNEIGFYSKSFISAMGLNPNAGSGGGLIETVYGYSDLGGTFSASDYTNTFNADTINRLASRITTLENTSLTSVPWGIITGKPTTLAGYGITDAMSASTANSTFVKKAGDALTGTLSWAGVTSKFAIALGTNNYISIDGTENSGLLYWNGTNTLLATSKGSTVIRSNESDLKHNFNGTDYIIFDARNYTNYVPTKTGTGASGTWNITSKGIRNHSISNSERLPDFFPNYEVYAWYNNTGTPTADWWSGITVRAGSAAEGYSIYQLCGYVGKSSLNYNPRWRTSNPSANSWNAWRILATLEDNVASATKLQTKRLIFGKYFDGTANVEGQAYVYGTNGSSASNYYMEGGLQIREQGLVTNTQTSDAYAPRIGFHWGNRFGSCLIANTNGFKFMNNDLTAYKSVWGDSFYANDKYRFNGSSTIYGKNSIELYYTLPFIDFHFNNADTDYTSRIIENASGQLNINGVTMAQSYVTSPNGLSSIEGRFNEHLSWYNNKSSTATGTICITLPNGWNNSMNIYEIYIYEYNSNNASIITIGGYNYVKGNWFNTGYHTKGTYAKGVRLGYNGSKCVILLGTTTTVWNYPQVFLKAVMSGFYNQSSWANASRYSISLLTSESGISAIYTPSRTQEHFGNVNVQGNLTVTGNQTFSGRIYANNGIRANANNTTADWSTAGVFAGAETYPLVLYGVNGGANTRRYYYEITAGRISFSSANDSNSWVKSIITYLHSGNVAIHNSLGIGTTAPSYPLHVVGGAYSSDIFSSERGLYTNAGGCYFTHNGSYAEMASNGNEMLFSGVAGEMHVNYRVSSVSRGIPTKWYIHAGTSTSYASLKIGTLDAANYQVGMTITSAPTTFQTTLFGGNNSGYRFKMIRNDSTSALYGGIYSPVLTFSTLDTHGYIAIPYNDPNQVYIGGGAADKLNYQVKVFTSRSNLDPDATNTWRIGRTDARWSQFYGVTGDFSGRLNGSRIGVTNTSSSTGYGISLYGDAQDSAPTYGLFFGGTGSFGKHGAVSGNWATYFTMSGDTGRGWIFRKSTVNVASLSNEGVLNLRGIWTNYPYNEEVHSRYLGGNGSYAYEVILLLPYPTATNQTPTNKIQGRFIQYTNGANQIGWCDIVVNMTYNVIKYNITSNNTRNNGQYALATCLYGGVRYLCLKVPYAANRFDHSYFYGTCYTSLPKGSKNPVLPLLIKYKTAAHDGIAEVINDTEINNSLSNTIITSFITSASRESIYKQYHVYPGSDNMFNIGDPALRWANMHSVNVSTSALNVSGASSFTGRITADGGISSGYSNTSYKVSVASFICNSWVRTTGATGWYSESYAGGIYMTDSTYVRVYNGKAFLVPSTLDSSTSNTDASIRTSGGIYVAKTIRADLGVWSNGYMSAKGQNTTSDMRLKNKGRDVFLPVKVIAEAPAFEYTWKDGTPGTMIGSSAQYWRGVNENFAPLGPDKRHFEMTYGNLGVVLGISLARHFETLEERMKRLEKENLELREFKRKVEHLLSA